MGRETGYFLSGGYGNVHRITCMFVFDIIRSMDLSLKIHLKYLYFTDSVPIRGLSEAFLVFNSYIITLCLDFMFFYERFAEI